MFRDKGNEEPGRQGTCLVGRNVGFLAAAAWARFLTKVLTSSSVKRGDASRTVQGLS